ncbi:MAG: hypothetical protein R2911_35450 [Caldilineaceae bacterium]
MDGRRCLGLEVLCGGKARDAEFVYDVGARWRVAAPCHCAIRR